MNWASLLMVYYKCYRWIGESEVGVASVENRALTYIHTLQWQSQCFYSMTTVSKYEIILLGWITDNVMASSYSGSRGSTLFLISLLFI